MGREKIFAGNVTDESLISKIYKQLVQLNNKTTTQSKNCQRPKQTFLQRHTGGHQEHEKMLKHH